MSRCGICGTESIRGALAVVALAYEWKVDTFSVGLRAEVGQL